MERAILEEKARAGDLDAAWQLAVECMEAGASEEGEKWFDQALEGGQVDALLCAAEVCLDKDGMAYSPEQAEMYLRRAADKGEARALLQLGKLSLQEQPENFWEAAIGFAQEENRSPQVLPQHEKQFGWYRLAAEAEDTDALYYVALAYHLGYPVGENQQQAFQLLTRAVEKGNLSAMYLLGYFYETGIAVEPDADRAVALYTDSGEQGVRGSLLRLFVIYRDGLGRIAPDRDKALRYLWLSGEGRD